MAYVSVVALNCARQSVALAAHFRAVEGGAVLCEATNITAGAGEACESAVGVLVEGLVGRTLGAACCRGAELAVVEAGCGCLLSYVGLFNIKNKFVPKNNNAFKFGHLPAQVE